MPKKDDNHNAIVQDTAKPLGQIRDNQAASGGSVVSAVLDIQKHIITRNSWIKSLEVLYLDEDRDSEPSGKRQRLANGDSQASFSAPDILRREWLNPVADAERNREYIAVSYTWGLSEEEQEDEDSQSYGSYYVESRNTGEPAQPSSVRDVIWQRILHYAGHVKCDMIWIDRECVVQDNAKEKETAIQNMHLVYSLSRRPIALLTHVIQDTEELELIIGLLLGNLREENESAALDLLDDITSDLWWQRAWTFQEDYRASVRMTLLIPHTSNLEHRKRTARDRRNQPLLGTLPGEICMKSADFRACATAFCLRYRQQQPEKAAICDKILATAGKYTVLLQDDHIPSTYDVVSRSMTPTILADLGRRGISTESDRLAIAANCCSYTTRLDTTALNRCGSSLSLSMLALYLINGEIMDNRPQACRGTLSDNIFAYLTKQSLRSFKPTVEDGLTFIKSCRFVDPVLTPLGTRTYGHLWRLGKVIRPRPLKRNKFCTLLPLETLATDLHYNKYGKSYKELAAELLTWVGILSSASQLAKRQRYGGPSPFPNSRFPAWRELMGNEVEEALLKGKALRLASLVDPANHRKYMPYTAIFVGEDADDWAASTDGKHAPPSYVFTSIRPVKDNGRVGDISKNVSLEVESEELEPIHTSDEDGKLSKQTPKEYGETPDLPKLYIKRWLNGLCLSASCAPQPVLFPWPADLVATSNS